MSMSMSTSDGLTSPTTTTTNAATTPTAIIPPHHDRSLQPINDNSTNTSKTLPKSNAMFQIPSFQPPPPPFSPSKTVPSSELPTTIKPIGLSLTNIAPFNYIFDIRSYNSYLKSHIINAINIKIPSTLLKRKSLNLSNILELINLPSNCKQNLLHIEPHHSPITILFYDDDSYHDLSINLYQILLKFYLFNPQKFHLYYMGFKHTDISPGLMESSELKCSTDQPTLSVHTGATTANTSTNKSGHSSTSSISGISIDDQFLNSIKKNPIDESHSSQSYNLNTFNLTSFPTWLQFINDNPKQTVIDQLLTKFKKLEQSERLRIKSLLLNSPPSPSSTSGHYHDNEVICTPNTLCPNCDEINYKLPNGSIENGLKNRYNNVWPYEHSRVKINKSTDEEEQNQENDEDHDDYFNANFINCNHILQTKFNNYIATQNPLQNTIRDFWKIIDDFKIKIIISLDSDSNNRYLSSTNSRHRQSIICSHPDYIIRKLDNDIYHFQILNWPDFNVPTNLNSLLSLIEFKNQIIQQNPDSYLHCPILVHCSAGCGRTGVFITIDTLINKYNQSGPEAFFSTYEKNYDLIYKLINYERTQRISMVQNFQQYLICYELIMKYLKNQEQTDLK